MARDHPIEVVNESCAVSSFVYEAMGRFYPDDPNLLNKLWYKGDTEVRACMISLSGSQRAL